jgi:sugar phosphate permease
MPPNRKTPRIFYGWWIVGACFVIALYTAGVVFYGFTTIFEPIANEFGWSYTQISIAASIRGLEAGLLAPLVGMLVDRWGPRRLIFSGVFLTSLGLILLSRVTSLGMFYVAFVLISVGISNYGISVTATAVAQWFRRKVGLATGIMVCGYGAAGFLVPVMVRLIDLYDWRTTVFILGLGMLVIGLPISLLVRQKPEQYGYLPDGEVSDTVMADEVLDRSPDSEVSIGVGQAMRSRTFWHIALGLIPQFVAVGAVITHIMPYFSSMGISRSMSGLVTTAVPLLSIGGRFGFGWLGDKFNKRRKHLAAGALTMLALGLILLEYTSVVGTGLVVPFLIFFGFGYGGNITMVGILLREYFGRGSFGTIIGFIWGILMLGNVVGPPLAGWIFDNWGSYQGAWLVMAGLTIMGAIIMLTTPPVSRK